MNPGNVTVVGLLFVLLNPCSKDETASDFLSKLNQREEKRLTDARFASWAYESNTTKDNLRHMLAVRAELAKEKKRDWQELRTFNWQSIRDYDQRRQFRLKSNLGAAALPEEKQYRLSQVIKEMKNIYATTTLCTDEEPSRCNIPLEPDIVDAMATSRDPKILALAWIAWRENVGPKCKPLFEEYVALSNEAAWLNNYTNYAEVWLDSYENPYIIDAVEMLWRQLKPLYLQIHAYVRTRLRRIYGLLMEEKGPIPAHFLGNMWAEKWGNITHLMMPFPNKQPEDLSEELRRQNYTPRKIFEAAESFFTSINLTAMPETFWRDSILEKPKDRDLMCNSKVWDFANGKDFRIKQCTEVNIQDFIKTHHEMGHIEYYLQYKDQPVSYRHGANEAFHEAIGGTVSLSVQSRKHLRKIGLLKSQSDDPEELVNMLFKMGMDKIVSLPFVYSMDLWRWGVFKGEITPDQYNCKWWALKEAYQGIEAPTSRGDDGFDPGSNYRMVANIPALRHFTAFVLQFQLHRALCIKAGQYDPDDPSKPLHDCDIYQNVDAGNSLKKMLQMGSSRPWSDALEVVTGRRTMDASAVLEYFKPLQEWLEKENKKNRAFIGWKKSTTHCFTTAKPRLQM